MYNITHGFTYPRSCLNPIVIRQTHVNLHFHPHDFTIKCNMSESVTQQVRPFSEINTLFIGSQMIDPPNNIVTSESHFNKNIIP